jgi:hypothetical protein
MSSTVYNVPYDIKMYDCPTCNKNVQCLRWKEGENGFKCENCWETTPENSNSIYEMIAEKINSILKR